MIIVNFLIILVFFFETNVNFGTSYITKSERFFTNPLKFDPNRWEREEAGTEIIDPYSNLSFG
jgi:cytochrome P450